MQNNLNLSFSSYMYKLYTIWNHWYCGPNNTMAGKVARATCWISTVLMVVSGAFYLPYYTAIAYINHNKVQHNMHLSMHLFLLTSFSTASFYLGLSGYIMTPIIGHGLCGIVDVIRRNQNAVTVDIEQQEGSYELSNNASLPPYEELFFGDEPPSYEEILAVNVTISI